MKILGICGSLRKESYNLKLLAKLGELMPKASSFTIAYLHDIPVFNEDEEAKAIPDSVHVLAQKITAADALVFGCPEYNYSIPGVLKNAIDWVSRYPKKPFSGKKAAIIGASPGRLGTARAQYHLRQVGVFIDVNFFNRPEIMLGEAHKKFDAEGRLTDSGAEDLLKQLVTVLHH